MEHVIPQSFGKFQMNLTLHCVCRECNGYLGRVLDEKLTCDSIEATDRIRFGVKKPSKFRSLGKRSSLHARITEEGPLKGAYAHHVPGKDGERLPITYTSQVGFAHSPEGPFEWFRVGEIPPKDVMKAKGYGPETVTRYEGFKSADEAQQALVAAGYSVGNKADEYRHQDRHVPADTIAVFGDIDSRAVAKLAFNYLAAMAGPSFALMPQFNDVRRYIREGVEPSYSLVLLQPSPASAFRGDTPVNGHYLAVERVVQGIVGQVSLFMRTRYAILLSADEFLVQFPLSWSNFFDLGSKEIGTIPPLPLLTRDAWHPGGTATAG